MKQFPTCVTYFKIYVKKEMAEGKMDCVEKVIRL